MKTQGRIESLDALRGFDMLWITGGGWLLVVLADLSGAGWLKILARQMEHAPWEGFRFYDLIFPLFMFIAGVAIPLSLKSKFKKKLSKKDVLLKVFKRMVILIVLGVLYNGVFRDGFENARYASVLGQIGIAYFFASIVVFFSKSLRTVLFWIAGILAGIAFIQLFIPVPGIGSGVFTPQGCINGYIDRLLLPGRLAYGTEGFLVSGDGIYDALGILCIVSATGITLMGSIAGFIFQKETLTGYQKTVILSISGIALIILGLAFSSFYPVIKSCWTSTYNLLAGGISFLLVALFYLVIDVWGFRKWAFYFKVIGLNSVFIYLFVRIIPAKYIAEPFLGWLAKLTGEWESLILAIGYVVVVWLLLYFMYKKKVFVKV